MTAVPSIPLLAYGVETKSRFAVLNGLRRLAGVSCFLPLIILGVKKAAETYLIGMQANGAGGQAVPVYQQYAAAIDLMIGTFAIGKYAMIDLMIFAITLTVFGVVVAARVTQSQSRIKQLSRNNLRAILLGGVAVVLSIQSLVHPWHAATLLTLSRHNTAMTYSARP